MRLLVRGRQKSWPLLLSHNHRLARVLPQFNLARIDIRPCFLHDIRQVIRSDAYDRSVLGVQRGDLEWKRTPESLVGGGKVGDKTIRLVPSRRRVDEGLHGRKRGA